MDIDSDIDERIDLKAIIHAVPIEDSSAFYNNFFFKNLKIYFDANFIINSCKGSARCHKTDTQLQRVLLIKGHNH